MSDCDILLLGGTAETAGTVAALLAAGYRVLVSTATEIALTLPDDPRVERRCGPLDAHGMARLVHERHIRAVVDVTHPYATQVKAVAREAASAAGVPYLRFERPASVEPDEQVILAEDHEDAARRAAEFGVPILLTIGSRNLAPYVREAKARGCALFARVLPESRQLCLDAGVLAEHVIAARGPFSVEENCRAIQAHRIGVLVTKDGGEPGGVPAKLDAARRERCRVVVVKRPAAERDAYDSIEALVARLGERTKRQAGK